MAKTEQTENQPHTVDGANCTTNSHDLAEAAKLQARLSQQNSSTRQNQPDQIIANHHIIQTVFIDEGAHKYVLVSAIPPSSSQQQHFVYSKYGAPYHRNVAEFLVPQLESNGYSDIRILGGGRIYRDDEERKIKIFGYSYGFGRAPHELSTGVVVKSGKFDGWDITWSNDGY
mmetsp:Transcript_1160/g.2041  ORF Transcript_1160/g.2041 Transcript_1160/m.2041 type:complete len:172 (+) Transcript_1160:69-584(+)